MSYRHNSSRTFSSRQARSYTRNQNTTAYVSAIKIGPVSHTVLIALMVVVLGLLYLTQVTKTSTYGYEINQREDAMKELLAQKEDLQVENAKLESLDRIKSSDVARAYQAPVSVDYAN